MGLFDRSSKKTTNVTDINTTNISTTRDIGFTGEAGVTLATNLAIVGKETAADQLESTSALIDETGKVIGMITDVGESFFSDLFDASLDGALIAKDSFDRVVQEQGKGFNRLVGGASDLVETAGRVSENQIIAGEGIAERVINAAREQAGNIQQGADAFLRSATTTIERLGPQTRQNQNIAYAGLAIAVITVGAFFYSQKRK